MAYAGIAGLPPQFGLYTLVASLIVYALFGSSRHLSVGATSASAALIASTLVAVGATTADMATYSTYAIALVMVIGVIFLLAGLARLGWVTQFLSKPVMDGFVVGLAIFFFIISAALALPTPSRMGLDPNTPIIGRVTSLTEDVREYMTVLIAVNFLVGLGDTILLLFMGVDYAVLWGLLAWFMGYIPSIGFIIALIPPVLMAYAQYNL